MMGTDHPMVERSGRFLVRIPKTLHAALVAESRREGVSLNQLVLSKLSISIGALCSNSTATQG